MKQENPFEQFQQVLDRVAQTGHREEVDQLLVPDVLAWDRLKSRGCIISVEHGRWWVLPPDGPRSSRAA